MSTNVVFDNLCSNATVAANDADIDRLVDAFLSNSKNFKRVIGLSAEESQVEVAYGPLSSKTRIDVLVLCDGHQCLVVQRRFTRFPPKSLFNFLNLPLYTFVGFDIQRTVAKLQSEYSLSCKNFIEAGHSSWCYGRPDALTCRRISQRLSSVVCPRSAVFDNWDNYVLSDAQIRLAVANAYTAFKVGEYLLRD